MLHSILTFENVFQRAKRARNNKQNNTGRNEELKQRIGDAKRGKKNSALLSIFGALTYFFDS